MTGVSVGRPDIDRARPDRIEETGVYIEYRPFIFSTTGGVRRGIELFPYTDGVPANLGDISNTVGQIRITRSR